MKWLALFLTLLASACARPLPPDVTELVYATPYSPGHPFSRADKVWMDFLREQSGGTLVVRPSWSGALLSSDHSMEELRHGVADIGLITPIYVKGGAHLIRVQSGFYSGARSIESQVGLYRCMAAADSGFARELHGLKILAVQGGNLPGIITTDRPVRSLADLQGMRIRAPTELLTVLRHMGADPVNMPMGEVYSALAKGVLDGVVAPADTFRALHFAEVADHFTTLEVPRGAYPARAMGERRWNSLSDAHRKLLEEAVPVWEAALAKENRAALTTGLDYAAEKGVQVHSISPAEQKRFEEMYLRDASSNAARLARYGIDGDRTFRLARASIGSSDTISCKGKI